MSRSTASAAASAVLLAFLVLDAPVQAQSTWRLVPEVRFGDSDDAATQLTRVLGVEVTPDGRVLIQDAATQNIRRFASNGRLIDEVGRKGAGPGEFRSMTPFGRAPDGQLWINDPGNNRFSIHAADGSYLRSMQAFNADRLHVPIRFDAAGKLYVMVIRDPGDPDTPMGLQRRRPDGAIIDTVPVPTCLPRDNAPVRIWRTPAGVVPVPLSHWASEAYTDDGAVWCTPGTPYTVKQFGLAGREVRTTIQRTAQPLPIAKVVRDSAIAALREQLRRRNIPETAVRLADVPTEQASIIGLAADDLHRVWVRVPSRKGTEFEVFAGSGGGHVATVSAVERLDRAFQPVIRKDKVYAVVLDEDDVPTVVRFRIERFRGSTPGR